MTLFDRVAKFFKVGDSLPSVGQVSSESAEAPEITGGPIQLRRFSVTEMEVAIERAWILARNNPRMDWPEVLNHALSGARRYRKESNRRRTRAGRQNKKAELQSSNQGSGVS